MLTELMMDVQSKKVAEINIHVNTNIQSQFDGLYLCYEWQPANPEGLHWRDNCRGNRRGNCKGNCMQGQHAPTWDRMLMRYPIGTRYPTVMWHRMMMWNSNPLG